MKRELLKLFLCATLTSFAGSCSKPDSTGEPVLDPEDSISLILPQLRQSVDWIVEENKIEDSGHLICEVKKVKWGPSYDNLISMDPQGEVIFPGATIDFESFDEGKYIPIVGNRKPITISISLSNISGKVSASVEDPKLSTVREAIQSILQTKSGSNAAIVSWNRKEIYSEEHFSLAIAANYGNLIGSIQSSFDFQDREYISRLLLQFTQEYYSIDLDLPEPGLNNFFNATPKLQSALSPVYVSSVKYGRKVFFTIESKTLGFDQSASIEASFRSFGGSGGLRVDEVMTKLLKEKSIKAVIIGGPSTSAIQTIEDERQLKKYLIEGANYSRENIGVPLSYNLRFLVDNSVASLIRYDEFSLRSCKVVPTPEICYYLHIAGLGNTPNVCSTGGPEGEINSVKNSNKERGEGFGIFQASGSTRVNLRYKGYLQDSKWTDWVNMGGFCGTMHEKRRLEAIRIELTGKDMEKYDINYQVEIHGRGWSEPCKNGKTCGTTDQARPITNLKIWVSEK